MAGKRVIINMYIIRAAAAVENFERRANLWSLTN